MPETMDPYVSQARAFVGDKAWTVELLLQLGVHLAQAVNKSAGLSGQQKSELVCQTILQMLEDGEKADKARVEESTETDSPTRQTVPWEDLKNQVKTVLPTTLSLVISAAHGKFELEKAVAIASQTVSLVSRLSCCTGDSVDRKALAPAPKPSSPKPAPEPENKEPPKESQTQEAEAPSQVQTDPAA